MKNILLITSLIIISYNCKPHEIKPPEHLTLDEILPKHQWRKTEKAIYNTNNELEEYLFTFEDAEDCEKNTYILFSNIYSGGHGMYSYHNLCIESLSHHYMWSTENDSIFIKPYKSDTISIYHFEKHINYYNEKTYILDYDTTINDINKKIKETFTAFPKK